MQQDVVYNIYKQINGHYMTITEVIEYSEDVEYLVDHRTMLRVSSWGIEYYIDYEQYAEHFGISTNMLYIGKY